MMLKMKSASSDKQSRAHVTFIRRGRFSSGILDTFIVVSQRNNTANEAREERCEGYDTPNSQRVHNLAAHLVCRVFIHQLKHSLQFFVLHVWLDSENREAQFPTDCARITCQQYVGAFLFERFMEKKLTNWFNDSICSNHSTAIFLF